MKNNISQSDIKNLDTWWVEKSRINFFAYRQYIRSNDFLYNWFVIDICEQLQQFYVDLIAGKRPVLLIQAPPQHGKSWAISDFIAWISGKINNLRSIYASYSDTLGVRCNSHLQRLFDNEKHYKIFPDHSIGIENIVTQNSKPKRNSSLIEFVNKKGVSTGGQFRNTTVQGRVNGESLDLGVIDDAVKGREKAHSITDSEKIWNWFTDDFMGRFSNKAGLLVVATRWTTHDLIGRLLKNKEIFSKNIKIINYKAIATTKETNRNIGESLFPALKPVDFLMIRKKIMADAAWEATYQGEPTVSGGNIVKDDWWHWWKTLPKLKYKFITADTAQKDKRKNDWTVFQCWGFGFDDRIYLIDKFRAKLKAPELRIEAEVFYKKHDTKKNKPDDPILKKMYIEDKSSGTGLIQELRKKGLRIEEVPRNTDKNLRAEDGSVYIQNGQVVLNVDVPGVGNLTKEAREFPSSEFDDDFDTLLTAIEISFINETYKEIFVA